MHTIGVSEARNRLTALLGEVEGGGEVIITRRGRPIARLTDWRGRSTAPAPMPQRMVYVRRARVRPWDSCV